MLKRMNKATSLLVAAAAIISIMPANAADYKKIDSQEGTIYNAMAYKDGKFYIDGEVNNKDESAYYLSNGKYNNLSNIDSGSSIKTYGSKYLDVQGEDHFIDLNNGSVTDDSIKENSQDDASAALRKNLKKDTDGRYDVTDAGTVKSLNGKQLTGNKFSDIWYGVQYAPKKATNGNTTSLNIYTNANGNYIDADYNIGSIKVTTTNGSTDKTTTISNTNDKYDGAGASDAISVSVVSNNSNVIGQDADYIYRSTKITVTSSNTGIKITKINGIDISGKSAFDTSVSGSVSFNVIQKISKAQASGNINGAKYANSVTNYIISQDNGNTLDSNHALLSNYTISNGKLINYTISGNSIKTQTITLSSKSSYYYTDVSDQSSDSAEVINSTLAVDTDANGNLWRLSSGYIYKWDNNKTWTKVYKVDGSFNKISVYDDNNIVAWNQSHEVYSVIGGQASTQTQTGNQTQTPVETTPIANKGWVKSNEGWTFYNASGNQLKGQWVNDGGVWYYIKADGIMATGWIKDGGNWYYLNGSGSMKTGWLNDNGTWYFLQPSGAMQTGWLNDNGTWYYLNGSGAMLSNTTINGYKLGASGAWIR
ncbi:N-acetylmuramoyl-L-alanine amidase family protein [Clostridium saccharobutylicum]|uniref:Autolysin n=1 Tax=Clostridium saccharobutylicum TaxID=169679 RepID=A0A1S8N1W4_CLOSA|nr:N-acetylmuramoyl-L-alanine amidase family protein [Clostridium saccharobutylicum]OOM10454.1 autolysin [Clostridium saccharobutylicum]